MTGSLGFSATVNMPITPPVTVPMATADSEMSSEERAPYRDLASRSRLVGGARGEPARG